MSMEVANIILQQLGGAQFIAMTGAKFLVGGENRLSFRIGSGAKDKITNVTITLDIGRDTYRMDFFRIKNKMPVVVKSIDDVYCDQLQDIFEETTGFYTTLFPRKKG